MQKEIGDMLKNMWKPCGKCFKKKNQQIMLSQQEKLIV